MLLQKAAAAGFDRQQIALELGTVEPVPLQSAAAAESSQAAIDRWAVWAQPPLLDSTHQPRAWRLDTDAAQVFEIPALLSRQECAEVMEAIDHGLVPSTVTRGPSDYRTSRTCHLQGIAPALTRQLDHRFADMLGVDPALSEPLQGQRYDPGEYFKAHTDWFAPGTKEYQLNTQPGGQRTWTIMVYLNSVPLGGETVFERLGRAFTPVPGLALAWNNLHPDGSPNHATLHEAMPVEEGRKYVITKWFRAEPGRVAKTASAPST